MTDAASRLAGKVAVITGAASGIGLASALRFLREGANVVFADLNEANGQAAVRAADSDGYAGRSKFIKVDVSREDDVSAAIDLAVSAFGRLDCVFNNAGVPGALGRFSDMHAEEWDFTLGVLARGPFFGIKHASRVFKKQGSGGVIINTGSVAGMTGNSGPGAYSVAKAAVIHLSKIAALELAPHRVRVNAICPGAILTPIGGKDDDAAKDRLRNSQPWPDYGRAEDIAATAAFLASDDARFITGTSIVVDGGMYASGSNLEERTGRSGWSSISGIHHGTTGLKGQLRKN